MKQTWTDSNPPRKRTDANKRGTERRAVALPARLTWKDQRGATRFAMVLTRNVSDFGVYVECQSPVSIPLFRLVQFQLEREVARQSTPCSTRCSRAACSSAVYRVSPPSASQPQGLALRLMVDPRRRRRRADQGDRLNQEFGIRNLEFLVARAA